MKRQSVESLIKRKEDHTGKYFDDSTGYKSTKGMRIFGKQELSELVTSGFFELQAFKRGNKVSING